MRNLGYIKVGCAVPKIKVADCIYNVDQILSLIDKAKEKKIEILTFPELCITGYTCGDLFLQKTLINESEKQIKLICEASKSTDMLILIGCPIKFSSHLYNCAVAINNGKILSIIPKTNLPNYDEFYEKRWFSPGCNATKNIINYCDQEVPFGTDVLLTHSDFNELKICVEICEDLWSVIPPSSYAALNDASLILNLSASNELIGKSDYRRDLIKHQSASCISGYVYTSAGYGESTTDTVYGGHCLICENGKIIEESAKFNFDSKLISGEIDIEKLVHDRINRSITNTDKRSYREIEFNTTCEYNNINCKIDSLPFVPSDESSCAKRCKEIFSIQRAGLAKRLSHIGCETVVLGISGGLDSTLALLVCVKTLDKLGIDRKNILGITMPGFGTTDRTYNNAIELMKTLGVTIKEISIKEASILHFKDIEQDINVHDITYENTQARERTQILMDLSNKHKGIVVGTGDLSELALGFATYNGDHMSMYGVNSGIPKTLIRYLVKWIANNEIDEQSKSTLLDILDTPVSPELLPPDSKGDIIQKTEEVVGPYELHDFFLYNIIRFGFTPKKVFFLASKAFENQYDNETIYKWLRTFYYRFFSQQFKRSCLPDGPKVGTISLSPRSDWRMPSDASSNVWLKEMDEIKKAL